MKYSIKSDKIAIKAAKARKTIASNELYINMMNKKMSDVSSETITLGRSAINGAKEK